MKPVFMYKQPLSLKIHVIAYCVQVGEQENKRGKARGPVKHINSTLFKEKM